MSSSSPKPHSATLTWKASVSKVSGYRVYRATGPDTPPGLLASTAPDATQYVDRSVEGGRTYYYTVRSVAPDGIESVPSEQITVTIPSD